MDALTLYRKHAKKKVGGVPRDLLSQAERKALKADIQNLAELAKRKQLDCCTPREIAYEQFFAREHFELACWLKWFMAKGRARDEIEDGALIIFLLFEGG